MTMPRAQVYFSNENFSRIQKIITDKMQDGANRSEANVSSTVGMLVDIGLRIYEFREKKGDAEGEENVDPMAFNKKLMEQVLNSVYTANAVFNMMTYVDEIKNDNTIPVDEMKKNIKERASREASAFFGGSK
jgi:hypothetical protein